MTCPELEAVQAQLSRLPHHVIDVDLLVFRRTELETPSSWLDLARMCAVLIEAVGALRAGQHKNPHKRWRFEVPPRSLVFRLGAQRYDTLTLDTLTSAWPWSSDGSADASDTVDPAREQFAILVEERVIDVLLEVEYGIRRQRRAPKTPPARNPLAPHLYRAAGVLHPQTLQALRRVAQQMGPLPECLRDKLHPRTWELEPARSAGR